MKKHWKALTGLLVCFAILATGVVGFFMSNNMLMEESKRSAVAANLSGSLKADDFVILEIVPDKSYAQLGYLQEGSEPIDILEACKDGKAADIAKIAGDGVQLKKTIDGTTYKRLSEVYEDMDKYWEKAVSGSSIQSNNKYTFVGGNSFVMSKNTLANAFSSKVGTDEEIIVKTVTANELNDATTEELKALLEKVDFVYISESYVQGAETEQKELAKNYTKEDINVDKTFASNNYDADWQVVKTIFEYVGDKENPLPIMMDQTIYDDSNLATKNVSTNQYALNRDVKYNKDTKDSWKVSGSSDEKKNLFHKTEYNAGSDKAASNNNMYKLYLMTMFRDPAEFYNLFVESGLVDGGTYALQSGDAAKYWNTYTFLPCKKEIKYSDHEKGTKDFWENEMAITLSAKDGKWINCNAISFDKNTASTFVDSKKEIGTIFDYTPRSCIDGRSYSVLELEPANSFSLSEAYIEQMLPYTSYTTSSSLKMKITKMTTAEYIGKIDALASKYDLIYIGNDIGGLHTDDAVTKTDYGPQNEDMDGVIYAHIGAKVLFQYGQPTTESKSFGGNYGSDPHSNGVAFFDQGDEGSLRYSGNDITKLKKQELITYLNTGLPIVVADGLIVDAKKSNPEYFNDVSNNNMRNFLKEREEDLLSLDFNYRAVSSEKAKEKLERLTRRKPTLEINSLTAGGASYTDLSKCNVYTFDKNSENRKFTFSYSVDNPEDSNADFILNFYVDKNADGRFLKSERVGGKSFKANGNNYSYTFSMNPNYTGAFTWKIEVYPRNNTGMVCSQVGYSTIRFTNNDVSKKTVHVLQVQAVAGDNKHNTSWGREKAQQIDLSDDEFLDLLAEAEVTKDYDIKITVIDLEAFTYGQSTLRSEKGGWKDTNYNENLNRDDLQEKYDMIIFGFADSYRDLEFNSTKIAQDVQDYIDAGKSVLFSHDLTSQINDVGVLKDEANSTVFMENTNGYGFNKWMRDAMGLDRYDQGRRVSSTKSCSDYTKTGVGEKYGFTYTALMQYSNFRRAWSGATKENAKDYFGPYKYLYANLKTGNKGWPDIDQGYASTKVTNVNDGQITKYPFDLSSYKDADGNYPIAKTHGQSYQLNMEADDVVCWFALSDDEKGKGWYSASPNDVANNYYIYNKGNVTYTGVGHSKLSEMTDFEKKLFINTIIAALRAGVEGPQPQITNGYNIPEGDEDRYAVYADVDADSDDKEFNKPEDVDFYAMDDSTKSEWVYVSLEVEQEDGTYKEVSTSDGYKLVDASGKEISPTTITKEDGTEQVKAWKIKKTDLASSSGEITYTIKYPRAILETKPSQNFKIYALSFEGEGKYAIKGYQYGALMRRALFKLD